MGLEPRGTYYPGCFPICCCFHSTGLALFRLPLGPLPQHSDSVMADAVWVDLRTLARSSQLYWSATPPLGSTYTYNPPQAASHSGVHLGPTTGRMQMHH